MQRFNLEQKKTLNLGQKILYISNFGVQFNKNYYQIFNQYSGIGETVKFYPKQNKK